MSRDNRQTEIKCKCGTVVAKIDVRGQVVGSNTSGVVECPGCHERMKLPTEIRSAVSGPQLR